MLILRTVYVIRIAPILNFVGSFSFCRTTGKDFFFLRNELVATDFTIGVMIPNAVSFLLNIYDLLFFVELFVIF